MESRQGSSAILEQNPFLDPFDIPVGGKISDRNQPLTRLQIPNISTLVFKTEESAGNLLMINISDALQQVGVTPQRSILPEDEEVGIRLDLNLFGTENIQTASQVNPSEIGGQTVGRRIPTNYHEARDALHMIVAQRTGKQNYAFGIADLKRIARNLNLSSSGNKDVLANRIRTAVTELFGIS